MKKYIYYLTTMLVVAGCNGRVEKQNDEVICNGNMVTVNNESPIMSKFTYYTIEPKTFNSELRTVGTIQAQNGHYAEVNVPFDGRVINTHVALGTKVSAGQTLFEMASPEYTEACKAYLQSKQIYDKAKADYERKKVLTQHGIISQRELQEASVEAENAKSDMESAAVTLKVFGTDATTAQSMHNMRIVAPISGQVVYNKVTPGAYIKADSEPLITVANLDKVWVIATIKEHFINSVVEGGKAEIMTESDPDNIIEGEILHVGNLVDEETRSIQVVIACNNPDTKLKHGMYVSVHFLKELPQAIVVPAKSVFQGDSHSYVFVCTNEKNVFERREVDLGSGNDANTEILIKNGLKANERIIVEGGLYLNN